MLLSLKANRDWLFHDGASDAQPVIDVGELADNNFATPASIDATRSAEIYKRDGAAGAVVLKIVSTTGTAESVVVDTPHSSETLYPVGVAMAGDDKIVAYYHWFPSSGATSELRAKSYLLNDLTPTLDASASAIIYNNDGTFLGFCGGDAARHFVAVATSNSQTEALGVTIGDGSMSIDASGVVLADAVVSVEMGRIDAARAALVVYQAGQPVKAAVLHDGAPPTLGAWHTILGLTSETQGFAHGQLAMNNDCTGFLYAASGSNFIGYAAIDGDSITADAEVATSNAAAGANLPGNAVNACFIENNGEADIFAISILGRSPLTDSRARVVIMGFKAVDDMQMSMLSQGDANAHNGSVARNSVDQITHFFNTTDGERAFQILNR